MILHLGVIEHPYSLYNHAKTTYQVAKILEHKYSIMAVFWRVRGQKMADSMTSAMKDEVERIASGQKPLKAPLSSSMGVTKVLFDKFITEREVESAGIPGVPTKAALKGVSHRFRHPYARHPRRPSFVDSGQYVDSFKAWVD